jgi:hypothetical protein
MAAFQIPMQAATYTHLIRRSVHGRNLEQALQYLYDMTTYNLAPELLAISPLVVMASKRGHPRLAIDLATTFEETSIRRLSSEVWIECLISSAELLYVCPRSTTNPTQ